MKKAQRPTKLLVLLALCAASAGASEHRDAPLISADPQADITDLYAFASPSHPGHVVCILNLYPDAPEDAAFPRRGVKLHFDLDGDGWQDRTFTFKFGRQKKDGRQKFKAIFSGSPDESLNRKLVKGKTTAYGDEPAVIGGKRDIDAFLGQRDDPFFADVRALDRPFVCPPAADTFRDANVNSIVLEVPVDVLVPGGDPDQPIGVWGETKGDQAGPPLTNTLLVPRNKLVSGDLRDKDRFNKTHPHEQKAAFIEAVRLTFEVFHSPAAAEQLARDVFPDVLYLDPSLPAGYPNGRRVQDDVVDILLGRVTNGVETTDCVNLGRDAYLEVFPYLASPN